MNFPNAFFRTLGSTGIVLSLAGVLGGCRNSGSTDASRDAAKTTIANDAKTAKSQFDEVKGITVKGTELSGSDAQGRPLWRVSAKSAQIFNQPANQPAKKSKSDGENQKPGDEKADTLKKMEALASQPRRAELTEATATLFREGKPETSFRSPRIVLFQDDKGVRMTMLGGMRAQSQGNWISKTGPVIITSPTAQVDVKARRIWAGKGVRLLQGSPGNQVNLVADQLRADTNLKTTFLSGGVKASAVQGQFSAREAIYNWETGRSFATGMISATHDGTTITGAKLEADTRAGRGVLTGGVNATGEQGKASAQSVRYDWKAHTLSASGGVLLTKDDVTVRAGQIETDDKFKSAVASGDVTLIKGDATLRANRVQTSGKSTEATASGGVLLTRGDATVSASQATATNIGAKNVAVNASGGVRVKKGDANISASRATAYNIGEKNASVTASGDVRVQRGGLTLTAGRAQATGLQDQSTLRVVAGSGVFAQSKDGSVRAQNATWGGGRVVASGDVTLLRDGNRLSGSRLECDDKFTRATLSGDVNGRMAKGETLGAGVLVYRKDQGVTGTKGVSARRGELRLRAASMQTSPTGDVIDLKGNVVVTNAEGATVRAPTVRYDRKAQKVFASGMVYLQDPKRGLRQSGRALVADLKLGQVTLTDVNGSGKMDVFKDKKLF